MTTATEDHRQANVPAHVPAELIKSFSFAHEPGMETNPFATVAKLATAGPRIFYDPQGDRGPGWVLTRAEDLRLVLWDQQTFSSKGAAGFSGLIGDSWDLIPLELDPPRHTGFRALLNPLFTPAKINELKQSVGETADRLIGQLVDQQGCEFMASFGRPFPITVFMRLLGLPLEQMPQFLRWEGDLLHSAPDDLATKMNAAREIRDYLRALSKERKAQPCGDLASFVAQASIDQSPLGDDEILGIYYLFFVGGLDTVAATLGFMFHWLATHPQEQAMLRADPSKHQDAIEEFLRAFSVVITRRRVMRDTEVARVKMKAGDWVTIPLMMGGLDPDDFPNPLELKLDRSPNRHMAFAFGPHRCIGSNLARREFSVALAEWLTRLPPFRLKPGSKPQIHGGGVFGVEKLELVWD